VPLQSAFVNTAKAILDFAEAMGLIKPDLFTKDMEELNTILEKQEETVAKLQKMYEQDPFSESNKVALQVAKDNVAITEDFIDKKQKQIDIQNKLKTSTDENNDSTNNLNNTIKDSIVITKSFADTVDGQLTKAFTDFFDITSKQFGDFKDLATSVARAVINELIQVYLVQNLVGMVKGAIGDFGSLFNGDFGNAVDGMSDFDGGGYTGKGIRAGGMDGKGGFMAMVHPNETVIDHTKGQGMQAAPTVNFNISTVDAAGFDQLLASRKGLITSIINNAMNNQGKMGVV
jgi:hypothetical protein